MDSSAAAPIDVKPGQLWRWSFCVGDGNWFIEAVTEEARHSFIGQPHYITIYKGDVFTVVVPDDPGPAQVPGMDLPRIDEFGVMTSPAQPPKRWHVVLLRDLLIWLDHDMFQHAELLTDS